MTTVRKDGRWYVSLFYSVAEAARGELDVDVPDADQAIVPDGAGSPEEAVDQMIGAVADLDLEGAIATLEPDEFEALQRYAPMFLERRPGRRSTTTDVISLKVSDTEYDVEERDDGRVAVGFTGFTIDAALGDGRLPGRMGRHVHARSAAPTWRRSKGAPVTPSTSTNGHRSRPRWPDWRTPSPIPTR